MGVKSGAVDGNWGRRWRHSCEGAPVGDTTHFAIAQRVVLPTVTQRAARWASVHFPTAQGVALPTVTQRAARWAALLINSWSLLARVRE